MVMTSRRRLLTGEQQGAALRFAFRSFRQLARGNPYVWEGELTPVGGSTYVVRIAYFPKLARPQVTVVSPQLTTREPGVRIPHTFDTGRICLHLTEEWNASMYLHQTIVPWTSLWLYYYEVWHATGRWLGGGHGAANDDKSATSPM